VPTKIYKDNFYDFCPNWVSMLNFVHCDLSLYVIIVSQLMNEFSMVK
jgi:hypothetical protein